MKNDYFTEIIATAFFRALLTELLKSISDYSIFLCIDSSNILSKLDSTLKTKKFGQILDKHLSGISMAYNSDLDVKGG